MILGKSTPPLLKKKPLNLAEWLDLAPRQKPGNLAEWLNVATRWLVPAAQVRVRAEIEAHYGEAVQAGMKRGLPEFDAHADALADLGDAQVAARRFRREHVTTWDQGLLTGYASYQVIIGALHSMILFMGLFPPADKPGVPAIVLIILGFMFACPAIALSVGSLVWRSRNTVSPRLIYLLLFMAWLNIGGWMMVHFYGSPIHDGRQFDLPEIAFNIFLNIQYGICLLRLCGKLVAVRKDALPPQNPSVA